jgi:hypothetical protein
MATPKRAATAKEVTYAIVFLRYLGADYHNNEMIRAVVAWFRQEGGLGANLIGNNPFNIRPGVASRLSSGVRTSTKGNGKFLIFATLTKGIQAAALVLKELAPHYGYGAVIRAAKAGEAVEFLAALALSSWDSAHYGVVGVDSNNQPSGPAGFPYTTQNHLIQRYL